MALLNIGNTGSTQNTTTSTTLGPLSGQEAVARGAFGDTATGQTNLFSAFLAKEAEKYFGKPGSPAVAPTPAGALNPAQMLPGIAGSQEFLGRVPGANVSDEIFRAYRNLLGRDASSQEITDWVSTGQGLPQILQAIAMSPEATARGVTPESLYQTFLGRAPGESELTDWRKATGVSLGAPGSPEVPATPPSGLGPEQKLFDSVLGLLEGRMSGESPIVSDAMRKQIGDVFAYQQERGLRDLSETARTQGQERGLNYLSDTPIAAALARANADFMANLAGQRAGAEITAGQTEMENALKLQNLKANIQAQADRNRLGLLTGVPGASGLFNQLLTQAQIAGATRTGNTTGSGTTFGTSPTGADLGGIGNLALNLGGPLSNLLSGIRNWWGTNSVGGVGNEQYGPFNSGNINSDLSNPFFDYTSEVS